ncbi:glycoside hydrolase family 9 protein [Streptomyces sp. NPDC059994]|uniref:glycoside hydrolase family 9 protein n=1 Tax=Streptomyces sp. NPDC059994 TaxID=3347029 RepID=UPI00369897DD
MRRGSGRGNTSLRTRAAHSASPRSAPSPTPSCCASRRPARPWRICGGSCRTVSGRQPSTRSGRAPSTRISTRCRTPSVWSPPPGCTRRRPAATATTYDAFAERQRGWALGSNSWGTGFMVGAGEASPHGPEHQAANLTGTPLRGAVVNGANAAAKLSELNFFDTMRPCSYGTDTWKRFDGKGSRHVDHVGACQTVEPASPPPRCLRSR